MDAHIEMAWEDVAGGGLWRQAAFAGLVLLFSLVVSTICHLGYSPTAAASCRNR